MRQGVLPFQYVEERSSTDMTAMAGLGVYLDLFEAVGLREPVDRHVGVRREAQGWTDSQVVTSLIVLNLVGGESVGDLRILEKDAGLGRMLSMAERHGMQGRGRRALRRRWRTERRRNVPSPSSVFRYLSSFHDEQEEAKREPHKAFIPAATDALVGLRRVNAETMGFVQSHAGHKQATLDMDATLIETHKRQASYCYDKYRAYQPLTTYWAEADQIVHSEFRDGNVPAGRQQLRVLRESLEYLPRGVEEVLLRSDTAGYQRELLRYCAEGRDERFGVIEFAVGADVTPELKRAIDSVPEGDWHELKQSVVGHELETGQQWAEVNFVPNWIGHKKSSPEYRFIAIRKLLRKPPMPGMEVHLQLSVPVMEMSGRGWYKVTALVTNRGLPGDKLIGWYRQRCGKGEEVHGVLKEDLAGGRLPSGLFGANAAWWAIAVLAFNRNSALKRLALGPEWLSRRLKAVRFGLIGPAGRVVHHARRLIIRLLRGHPSYNLLLKARARMLALPAPP